MSNPNHDEELYAQAAAELEDGTRDEGLWAKCFAECDGEENKAKARYIKTRAERLGVDKGSARSGESNIDRINREYDEDEKSPLQSNNETLIQEEGSDKKPDKEVNLTKGRIWKERIWLYGGAFAVAFIFGEFWKHSGWRGAGFNVGRAVGAVFAAWLMAGLPYLYYRLTENKLTRSQYRSCFVVGYIIYAAANIYGDMNHHSFDDYLPPEEPMPMEADDVPVEAFGE
jgi:hypothetical protein